MENKSLLPTSKVTQELVPSLFPASNLSLELVQLIFLKLPIEDLEQLWAVNCAWSILIKEIALNFYQNIFHESALWTCLPLADLPANMDNMLPISYFQKFLSESQLQKLRLENCGNLGRLINCQKFSSQALSNLLVGIDHNIFVSEEKYLIQQRRIGKQITITDFLKNPPSNWLIVARAYRHVETALGLLLLASFIFEDDASFSESICLILDRRLTYGLTGSGLGLLTEHTLHQKMLLSHLIDFSLGEGALFLKSDPEKHDTFQQNAQQLLYRLTDDNCWSLLGSQGPVLVSAIKRRCFPIIDSFGARALESVMAENPKEEAMLLILLERFGAEQLSKILPSLHIETNFQVIVNYCSQFMVQLLSELTFEQLRNMVNLLTSTRFFYLINGSPFLEFLKVLKVESESKKESCEKVIIETSSKIAPTRFFPRIICDPRELLLGFVQLKTYYVDEIIKSQCIDYLLPRDILVFLKEYPVLWDISPLEVLERFTAQELLALAAINIKAVPCIVERGYLASKFTDLKDFVEFVIRYIGQMSKPLQDKCTEAANAHFKTWVHTPGKEDTYTYIHWYILFPDKYPNLLDNITDDWLIQLRALCQSDIHDTLLKKIGDLQNIKAAKKQIAAPKSPDNPILLSNIVPSNIPKIPSAPLALPLSEQHISPSERKKAQEATQPASKKPLQNQEDKPQSNKYSLIVLSILKGFFVGVLVTGIAVLLLMFINYQMNVPLLEIIDNLWIAGIIGAFAELVATACYFADTKVFESSNCVSINEKADNPKPFSIPAAQPTPTADPAYQKPFSPAAKTADTPRPPVQQIPKQTLVDNQNGIS